MQADFWWAFFAHFYLPARIRIIVKLNNLHEDVLMKSALFRSASFFPYAQRLLLLFCFVISGMALGVLLSCKTAVPQGLLTGIFAPVTFWGSMGVSLFPFLVSLIAIYFLKPWGLYPVCFFRAFSFGFVNCLVANAFSTGGNLLRPLLLFTDTVSFFLLCFLWIGSCSDRKASVRSISLVYFLGAIFLALADAYYISPFWASTLF